MANHPWVTDTQQELDRFTKERDEKMAESLSMMAQYDEDFGKGNKEEGEGGEGGEE